MADTTRGGRGALVSNQEQILPHLDMDSCREAPLPEGSGADQVNEVVLEIRGIRQLSTLRFHLQVGELVVRRFFDGDLATYRSQGRKSMSLRKLARHPELPISCTALYASINVFELVQRMGGVLAPEHLTFTHYQEVLPASPERQRALLEDAAGNHWSTAQLRAAVAQLPARGEKKTGGAPSLRPLVLRTERSAAQIEQWLDQHGTVTADAAHALQALTSRMESIARRCKHDIERVSTPGSPSDEPPGERAEGLTRNMEIRGGGVQLLR